MIRRNPAVIMAVDTAMTALFSSILGIFIRITLSASTPVARPITSDVATTAAAYKSGVDPQQSDVMNADVAPTAVPQ